MSENVLDQSTHAEQVTRPISNLQSPISLSPSPEPKTLLDRAARETNFNLKLPNYEGPLDVLLRLIEENQLEITAVSLASVADQFVAHMTTMPQRDPRTISGFVAVAAKLILLKSRALLPKIEITEEEQEEVDDLISQLKAYQIFKTAARTLRARQEAGLRSFASSPPSINPANRLATSKTLPLDNVTLERLAAAMQKVIARWMPLPEANTIVRRLPFTVHECMDRITDAVQSKPRVQFEDILEGIDARIEVVVTLLALLELLKRYEVRVYQDNLFGEIVIEHFPLSERPVLEEPPQMEFEN
jgi:segregation and condensation protein A